MIMLGSSRYLELMLEGKICSARSFIEELVIILKKLFRFSPFVSTIILVTSKNVGASKSSSPYYKLWDLRLLKKSKDLSKNTKIKLGPSSFFKGITLFQVRSY